MPAASLEGKADQTPVAINIPTAVTAEPATHEHAAQQTRSDTRTASATDLLTPSSSIGNSSHIAGRRKPRTPASEDWFAAHGKFIAVPFVLALIGTIYFALSNRAPTGSAAATFGPSPIDGNPGQNRDAAPNVSVDAKSTRVVENVAATSESKADLLPPSAPQLASQPGGDDKAAGKDKLFDSPAPKPTEERMATKPPTAPTNNSSSPAAQIPPVPPAAPNSAAPALSTTFPTSSTFVPSNAAPAPLPAYPVTS